jgi:hypothetical protein
MQLPPWLIINSFAGARTRRRSGSVMAGSCSLPSNCSGAGCRRAIVMAASRPGHRGYH